MKNVVFKKLYKALFVSMLYSAAANAQIIYTDVNPDKTFFCFNDCYHKYNLDLNNDGINDFVFKVASAPTRCSSECGGNGAFGYISVSSSGINEIAKRELLKLDVIDSPQHQYSWAGGGTLINSSWCSYCGIISSYGFWADSAGYLGLKLITGGHTYYGWARLAVVVYDYPEFSISLTIRDYAYNSIPNQPILTGETSCTAPTVTVKASGSLSFCNGDSVTLTANGSGYLYQWKKNGTNISGATSQTYVAKTASTYKCKVTNSCGSITSAGKIVAITCLQSNLAISDEKLISKATQLQITPNPFSSSTTISFMLQQTQNVSIRIFDVTGRLIKVLADAQMQAGTHQLTWNAKDEKGNAVGSEVYLLKMQAGNYVETKKISVIK